MRLWSVRNPYMTPCEVIGLFASQAFNPSRDADQMSIVGGWEGDVYIGTFSLVEGVNQYRLTCNREGLWEVTDANANGA